MTTPSDPFLESNASGLSSTWPVEADRMAMTMPLLDSLVILAGHYGRRVSRTSLLAGLPVGRNGLSPDLFCRAAMRADLTAQLAASSLGGLTLAPTLPCILMLAGGQACVLWSVTYPHGRAPRKMKDGRVIPAPETMMSVEFPETPGQRQDIGFSKLHALYQGHAFFIRPRPRMDNRVGPFRVSGAKSWFWETILSPKTLYQEVVIAAVMVNIFALAMPLFTMNVYDRVVPNAAFETLWVLAAGVILVFIFDLIIKTLRAHFLDHAGKQADTRISALLHEQMLAMTLASRPASAGVLASHMREFETIRDFFTSATLAAVIDLPFVFLFIALVAVIAGPLAFVPLVAVPIVFLVTWALQIPMEKIIRASMMENALKNAQLFETIAGLETIKTQAAESHAQRKWEELSVKAAQTATRARGITHFTAHFSLFIQQIVGVVTVVIGVYMIADGVLTMGALVAAVMLVARALSPLSQFSSLLIRYKQSKEALRQLDDLMRRPVERPDGKHFVSVPRLNGRVEFKDVIFSYPAQTLPALKGMSFIIEPQEKIAIIGAVGSGKTTIQRLLLSMYEPVSGSVQIDGSDVRQIDPADLRRNIGCVQQTPHIFYGSVRDNITMGHEMASDHAVLRAAEMAGVMDFLRDSQLGLDTQVGERGEALSGGQRQSVAIARAFLYDPPIMILDEPTSSMDPVSEMRIKSHLEKICENKTVILITHKGTMLSLVDKIMLIERGEIVAFGDREDIIRRLQAGEFTGGGKPS